MPSTSRSSPNSRRGRRARTTRRCASSCSPAPARCSAPAPTRRGWRRWPAIRTTTTCATRARARQMFLAINTIPAIVIGRIHGAALGGGSGLAAVCDIVVAADDAIFGFTETKLGILPAMISPYVLQKIGASAARDLFLTGRRFDANKGERDRPRSRGRGRRRSRRGRRSICERGIERIADRGRALESADSERDRPARRPT